MRLLTVSVLAALFTIPNNSTAQMSGEGLLVHGSISIQAKQTSYVVIHAGKGTFDLSKATIASVTDATNSFTWTATIISKKNHKMKVQLTCEKGFSKGSGCAPDTGTITITLTPGCGGTVTGPQTVTMTVDYTNG